MRNFDIKNVDKQELEALGLIDNQGQLNLSEKNVEQLSKGLLTDDITLKNIKLKEYVYDIECKLSLYEDANKKLKLLIHPYYKDLERNNILSQQERDFISKTDGTHVKHTLTSGELLEFGKAPYKHDPKQQPNYYVKLKINDNENVTLWGVNLEKELKKSNFKIGDNITVENTGTERVQVNVPIKKDGKVVNYEKKEVDRNNFQITEYDKTKDLKNKSVLIEYDKERKSFNILNSEKIPILESVNGRELSESDKQKLMQGLEVKLDDDVKLRVSPNKPDLFASNKKLLVASMLLDGGISFFLIKAYQLMVQKRTEEQIKKDELNRMYREQVTHLQKEVSDIIAKNGNNEKLNKLQDFLRSESIKAETNRNYKNPNKANYADDEVDKQEITLDEQKKDQQQKKEQTESWSKTDPEDNNLSNKAEESPSSIEDDIENREREEQEITYSHSDNEEQSEERSFRRRI